MRNARGLAYVSTSNTTASKWCPWELGYVDGEKGGKCAILPVLNAASSSFIGQEYLGLYPYITYETMQGTGEHNFWIEEQNGDYVVLSDWLKGMKPIKRS